MSLNDEIFNRKVSDPDGLDPETLSDRLRIYVRDHVYGARRYDLLEFADEIEKLEAMLDE